MVDLFDEIKEDVKAEQYAKLWKTYGNYMIGGAVAIVLITAVSVGWKSYISAKYNEQGSKLYTAFIKERQNQKDDALVEYSNLQEKGSGSYSAISGIKKALVLSGQHKVDDAEKAMLDVSKDTNAPVEIRDLADLLYLYNRFERDGDEKAFEALKDKALEDGAFKRSAMELLAFSYYKVGKYEESKKIFSELSEDVLTPARMKDKSSEMLTAIESMVSNDG